MKRVVIIGGGISGLATAWSLREHQHPDKGDFEIVVVEGRERVGGNIRTEKVDGFLIEGGPDCFISEKPWAMALCNRIGLGPDLLATNSKFQKTFVLSRSRLHELPEGVILMIPTKMIPLAFSSLITIPGKIRMALEYFVPRRRATTEESLGDFVRRRLGKEVLEKIAEPLIAGIHAGDPETMSVSSSFPKFVEMEQEHGSLIKGMLKRMASMKGSGSKGRPKKGAKRVTMFMTLKGGLTGLIDELTGRLKGTNHTRIMTGVKVTEVQKEGSGYRVGFEGIAAASPGDMDASAIIADAVIVAAPAHAASALLSGFDPELSKELTTIPYASTATISVAFKRSEITHPLNGFGFVVPGVEGRRIMAATWTSVKFDGRAPSGSVLIRCFVGGARNTALINSSDEELVKVVCEELSDIMGIEAAPVLSRVYRFINSMPQYTIGHAARVERIGELTAAHPGLYLTGSAYHGIGIADSVRYGEVVAKKALHYIDG